MSKKKILLSLDSWYPQVAGPNVVVSNYYKYLIESGNECKIFVPTYGKKIDKQNTIADVEVNHIPSIYIPFGGFRNGEPRWSKELNREAKRGVDIFHAHSPFALCSRFAELGKKYKSPSILTFHTKFKDEFIRITGSNTLTEFMMKRIMKAMNAVDYVFTVSEGAAKTLREYGYEKDITIIRNGTDMQKPSDDEAEKLVKEVNAKYGLTDCENVFLFVGRVVSVKNLPLAFDAMRILKARGVDFKFIVVGDGENLEEYKSLVKELGIADNVLFTGMITDRHFLQAFYLRADVFLFPSSFDTASLCPIEAATFSLPTLLIEGSPTSEIVVDNYTGFTESCSAVKWADKLYGIVNDKELLLEVSRNATKHVYRSWKDVVVEVENKYDEILEKYNKKK
ncbi:MAG: glycosyltransferase [Clostridiales bacterium]|nr:glycosyltransferase [Clostridiales bacterium]